MSAQPKLHYTLEEYLELDRNSDERLEFWDGEVFSMSGSDQHSQIEVNLITSLDRQLSPRGCRLFPACPCELSLKEIYRNVKFGAGKNK